MTAPRVDAVVVSYNRSELLAASCAALARSTEPANLYVVDNASADGSPDAVRRAVPEATLLCNETNVGFAAAVNRGAAAGAAPYLLLLNPDAVVRPDTVAELLAVLENDPEIGAAGPLIRGSEGELELSTGRSMSILNEAAFKILGLLHQDGAGPLSRLLERYYRRPRDTRSLTAACLLVRRQAWAEIGGLDERFFLYAEDVDLCRRLTAAKWKLRYTPAAVVEHQRGASGNLARGTTALHYRRSQLAFYDKHRTRLSRTILRMYLRIRFGPAALLGDTGARDVLRLLRSDGAPAPGAVEP